MSKLENLTAYTVVEKKELKEVNGYGYILSHNKTKARVAVIENDDTNKVFTIGFRTPPADDTENFRSRIRSWSFAKEV